MPDWSASFTNADDEVIDISNATPYLWPMALIGDLGGLPAQPVMVTAPDGGDGAVQSVTYGSGFVTIRIGIEDPSDARGVRDISRDYARITRPYVAPDQPNRGWLQVNFHTQQQTPDSWRLAVWPKRWTGWQRQPGESRFNLTGDLVFQYMAKAWEAVTAVVSTPRTAADTAWATYQWGESVAGDEETAPVWSFTGPPTSAQQVNTIRVENLTTGRSFEFTNLGLLSGQTLDVATGFQQKRATIGGIDVAWKMAERSTFWQLAPGVNTIAVTKDAATQTAVTLTYRPRQGGIS